MAWTTATNVTNLTGVTVSDETVALASAMIDTFTGADEELPEDAISLLDRRRLAKATAWQAIWIAGKPGLITERETADSVSSDTQSINRPDNASAVLAPLARREIMNLSWVGTRTVIVPPVSANQKRANFLSEVSDGIGGWTPL